MWIVSLMVCDRHLASFQDSGVAVMDNDGEVKELIRAAQSGDAAAQNKLAELLWQYCFAVAFRLTRDYHASEEIAQEAMSSAFRFLHTYKEQEGTKARTWVAKIVNNKVHDYRKSNGKLPYVSLDTTDEHGNTLAEKIPETTTDAVAGMLAADQLQASLQGLNQQQREILFLRFDCGLGYKEIGDKMGLSAQTVRQKLHRTLVELRDAMNVAENNDQPEL